MPPTSLSLRVLIVLVVALPACGAPLTGPRAHIHGDLRVDHSPRRILYESGRSIYSMTSHGERVRAVTHPGRRFDASGRWMANGRRIVFSRSMEGLGQDLLIVDRDGDHEQRLTKTPLWNDRVPAPSPDGEQVAFVRSKVGRDTSAIWLLNVSDKSSRQLTVPARETDGVSWAPSGRRLAFVKQAGKEPDIFIVRMDGTVRRVTRTRGEEYAADWSPDGRRLVYAFNQWRSDYVILRIFNLETGRRRSIGPRPCFVCGNSWPVWSPSGRSLLFFRYGVPARRQGLWRIDVQDGGAERLVGEAIPTDWR